VKIISPLSRQLRIPKTKQNEYYRSKRKLERAKRQAQIKKRDVYFSYRYHLIAFSSCETYPAKGSAVKPCV